MNPIKNRELLIRTGEVSKAGGGIGGKLMERCSNSNDGTCSNTSVPKVLPNLQELTNPAQVPVIPQGWISKPGRVPGSTIYYPPNTDPAQRDSTHIRVMPPGSPPVPGLENGYWISVKMVSRQTLLQVVLAIAVKLIYHSRQIQCRPKGK